MNCTAEKIPSDIQLKHPKNESKVDFKIPTLLSLKYLVSLVFILLNPQWLYPEHISVWFSILYFVNLVSCYLFKINNSISTDTEGFFKPDLKLALTSKWQLLSRHLRVSHAVLMFHGKIIHQLTAFPHLSCCPCIYQVSWHMKACDQTRLWSLCGTRRMCFFSHSQEQPQGISIIWFFFLYCTDTPFSMTVVLFAVCLSVLAGLLLSCACTAISVQNSFIPYTRDSGVSSCSKQAFEHTPMPLWGISSKLILPNSLHGSSFGVHFWSDVFLNPWLRVEVDPLLTAELQCPMTSLFLKLGLGLFTSAVYLIQIWNTAIPQKIYISICIIWVSNSSLNPNTTCA